jgi:hypothetical protein
VYLASAPAQADPGAAERIPLPLAGIVSRAFAALRPYDADMLGFFGDLAGLYGLPYDRAEFAGRARITFTDMVSGLAGDLDGGGAPVGLLVLAHSTPDGEPNWPACYLTSVLPGEPFGFAVADQGPVAPFTALRIAAAYLRADGARRAIVVVLDQTAVLGDPGVAGAPVPTQNRAVALVLDAGGHQGELSVRVSAGVEPHDAAAALLDGLPADGHPPAVVLGPSLAALAPSTMDSAGAVAVRPGLPCTGGWAALAAELDRWRADGTRRVVLGEYDPGARCLGRCVLTLPERSR